MFESGISSKLMSVYLIAPSFPNALYVCWSFAALKNSPSTMAEVLFSTDGLICSPVESPGMKLTFPILYLGCVVANASLLALNLCRCRVTSMFLSPSTESAVYVMKSLLNL